MIENLLNSGLGIILYFQSLETWLVGPMKFFSFLGNEEFFLLVFPAIYWCLNSNLGVRLTVLFLISNVFKFVLKLAFHTPRPFWYSPQVQAYSFEHSFGIPSGHSQDAAAVWGLLGTYLRRRGTWAIMIGLIILIGLSRLYLGMHFPIDVLVGWLTGGLILIAFLYLEKPFSDWFTKLSFSNRMLTAFIVSMVCLVIGFAIRNSLLTWQIPSSWVDTASRAAPEGETLNPLDPSALISTTGTLFGLVAGLVWIQTRGGFNVSGHWTKRALRYFLGLVGIMIFWYGLGMIFPRGEYLLAYIFRYLRYALTGFWIAGLAPFLFTKLNLAQPS